MHQLSKAVRNFVQEEEGATAVEYGVLVALVIAASVVIIGTLGRQVEVGFDNVSTELGVAGITDPGVGG